MAAPVIVRFQVDGVAQVQNAFRTIEQAAIRAEQGKTSAVGKGVRDRLAEEKKGQSQLDAIRNKAHADALAGLKSESQAAKAAKAQRVAEEKTGQSHLDAIRNKAHADALAGIKSETDAVKQGARARADAVLAGLKKEQAAADAARQHFARALGGAAATGAFAGARSSFRVGAGMVNSVLALGGGFGLADSVQKTVSMRGILADVSNSGHLPNDLSGRNSRKRSTAELEGTVRDVATTYGYTEEAAATGLSKFTKVSGDLTSAKNMLGPLAQLSRATGTELDHMAEAAGNVSMALSDMGEKGDTTKKTLDIMRTLAGQGKSGAIEISDLVTQVPKIVAAARSFEGNLYDSKDADGKMQAGNISKLGAIAQVARSGGGAWSAGSTGTAITNIANVFGKGKRMEAFEAAGIDIKGKDGKTRDVQAIMGDVVKYVASGKGGSQASAMNELMGSVFAKRATEGFQDTYNKGRAGKTGAAADKAGDEAVGNLWKKYLEDAAISEEQERKAYVERMKETDMQMAVMNAKFNEAVSTKLIPKLLELMPVIERMLPQFVDMAALMIPAFTSVIKTLSDFAESNKGIIAWLAANPIGALIWGNIAASLLKAGIGEAVRGMLLQLMSGGAAGKAGGAVGGAGGGGRATGLIAIGAAAIGLEKQAIDSGLSGQVSGQMQTGELISMMKSKDPKQIAEAKARYEQAKKSAGTFGGQMETMFGGVTAGLISLNNAVTGEEGNSGSDRVKKGMAAGEIVNSKELRDLISAAIVGGVGDGMSGIANPNAPTRQASSFVRESGER